MLWKPLDSKTIKNINQKATYCKITTPTAQDTWIDIFSFLEDLDWGENIYSTLQNYKGTFAPEPTIQNPK